MGPIWSATGDTGGAPKKQEKVMMLQENAELLNVYFRLRSAAVGAHNFKINEVNLRTIVKKENDISEAIAAAMPAGIKILIFSPKYLFYLALEIQLLCGCRIVTRIFIDLNMIQK